MITCRPVFRFDRVLRYTNRIFVSNPEWCDLNCTVKKMGGKKDFRTIANPNKQQRTVSHVWRPVATQASAKEDLGKNVTADSGNGSHTQEVECSLSGGISTAQHVRNDLTVEPGDGSQHLEGHCSMSSITSSAQPGIDKGEAANETRTSERETGLSSKIHSVKLEVGASLFRFVKGKGGSTQKQIEEEMGVKVMIPSSKEEDYVLVEGFSIDSVTKASEKIKDIVDEAVRSPNLDYSHFVSLPLAIHPELVDKLFNFQKCILRMDSSSEVENQETASDEDSADNEDKDQKTDKQLEIAVELKVQDDNKNVEVKMSEIQTVSYPAKVSKSSSVSDLGIDKSIFIKPKTFHLTVLMLKLWNKDRVMAATEVLQSISSKVMYALDNRPVSIRLKGLDSMRGSLAKARVLYAPVEEIGNEDRLLRACQVIIDAYVEAGLVLEKDAKQKLKLHATVMNARHRKGKKRTRKADSFDARGIFKQYGSEEWGEYLISEAHLSKRFVFDENGYYHCCSSIPFPKDKSEDRLIHTKLPSSN